MDFAPSSKTLAEALSIVQLANICFKKCIKQNDQEPVSPRTKGILNMLEIP